VETKTKQQNWDDWNRWADDKVQRAIEAEHKLMVAAIGDALGEIRAQMREHVEEEIGKLRATLCEFEKTALERLRQDVQNLRLDLLGRNVGQTSFAR
jgi:hypothetical protein